MVTEAFKQERTFVNKPNALKKTLLYVFTIPNASNRRAGQGQKLYFLLTSLVCGLNQCEISLPALAMIGLNRTSPVENKRTKFTVVSYLLSNR